MLLAGVLIEGHTFLFNILKLDQVCKTITEVGITVKLYQSKLVSLKQYFNEIQVQGNEVFDSKQFTLAVTSEEILRGMMFTYMLHRENLFNQIICTSTLSSIAFRPQAVQCDCV